MPFWHVEGDRHYPELLIEDEAFLISYHDMQAACH
jgi:hypothetical protein